MPNHWRIDQAAVLVLCIFVGGLGCQTLHNAGVPGMEPYLKEDPEKVKEERSHREDFIVHRDHESFYWLLKNKIANAMTVSEVAEVFGEDGEFTTDYKRLKSDGLVQTTDSPFIAGGLTAKATALSCSSGMDVSSIMIAVTTTRRDGHRLDILRAKPTVV